MIRDSRCTYVDIYIYAYVFIYLLFFDLFSNTHVTYGFCSPLFGDTLLDIYIYMFYMYTFTTLSYIILQMKKHLKIPLKISCHVAA